jgi:hypothetical protein
MLSADSVGRTACVNGVEIYFEVHGAGDPLVLLSPSAVSEARVGPASGGDCWGAFDTAT